MMMTKEIKADFTLTPEQRKKAAKLTHVLNGFSALDQSA